MQKTTYPQFESLQEVYTYLDTNAMSLMQEYGFDSVWRKYKSSVDNENDKKIAQWEMECWLFSFHGSQLFSFANANGDKAGQVSRYPDLEQFQQEALMYVKERALTTDVALLCARYHHLLWCNKATKNKQHAVAAIDHYLKAIKEYYGNLSVQANPDEGQYHIGKLFEVLAALVQETKYNVDELLKLGEFLLFGATAVTFNTKNGIIGDMLKLPSLFKPASFENILPLYETELIKVGDVMDDSAMTMFYLPLAIKVAQKIKSDPKPWHDAMGMAYLRTADKDTGEGRAWIRYNTYSKAIDAFRLAGNNAKKKEAEKLYAAVKPAVKLDEYTAEFDETSQKRWKEQLAGIEALAKKLLRHDPYSVYRAVAAGKLLPPKKDIQEWAKDQVPDFLASVTTVYFDSNKNVSSKKQGEEDKSAWYSSYSIMIKEKLIPFLHYIFIGGIKSGHLTYHNFIGYLVQCTWIGRPETAVDLGGHPEETNWIKLVAPSLVEYFMQVQASGESKYYRASFILCIDSLVLKIEGILRYFAQLHGIPVDVGKPKGMQRTLLHNIIENEDIKKHFNEDDRFLFEFVFSGDGGLNLRNNIAHSFFNEHEYSSELMLLLLMILLRIGHLKIPGKISE